MRRSSFSASVIVLAMLLFGASGTVVAGGSSVDGATLTPPAPPGALCWDTGVQVRCDSIVDVSFVNEPAFELPCGLVYATGRDFRWANRWYQDGLLVKRRVHAHGEGTWSLSPVGAGPVLTFVIHTGWGEVYPIPGDLSSQVGHQQGTDLLVKSPDGGLVAHVSGQTHGEERFTGLFGWFEGPYNLDGQAQVAADMCEALGA
jgi:hypothetical protein